MNGSGSITANRSASVTARRYPAARLAAPPASFHPRNAATSVGRFSLGVDSIVITSTLEVSHTRRSCPYYAGDARGLRRDRVGGTLGRDRLPPWAGRTGSGAGRLCARRPDRIADR